MKKLVVVVVLALVAFGVGCQTVVPVGSSVTIEWAISGADTVPPEQISYQVYYQRLPDGLVVRYATVGVNFCDLIFKGLEEGQYRIGVNIGRTVDGVAVWSEEVWSDTVGYPEPWLIAYYAFDGKVERIWIKE